MPRKQIQPSRRPKRNRQPTQKTEPTVDWGVVELPESAESQNLVASSRQRVDKSLELDGPSDGSSTILDQESTNPYIGKSVGMTTSAI